MERNRQSGLLRRGPNRVVDRVVELAPIDGGIRSHEYRHHAWEARHMAKLVGYRLPLFGLVHRWQRAGTEEPTSTLGQVCRAPLVVGASLCPTECHVLLALQSQHE